MCQLSIYCLALLYRGGGKGRGVKSERGFTTVGDLKAYSSEFVYFILFYFCVECRFPLLRSFCFSFSLSLSVFSVVE